MNLHLNIIVKRSWSFREPVRWLWFILCFAAALIESRDAFYRPWSLLAGRAAFPVRAKLIFSMRRIMLERCSISSETRNSAAGSAWLSRNVVLMACAETAEGFASNNEFDDLHYRPEGATRGHVTLKKVWAFAIWREITSTSAPGRYESYKCRELAYKERKYYGSGYVEVNVATAVRFALRLCPIDNEQQYRGLVIAEYRG